MISLAARVLWRSSPVLDNCPTGANVGVMQVKRCAGSGFDAADVSDVRRKRRAADVGGGGDVRSAHSVGATSHGRPAWSASSVGEG